jgi:hypothetical protein
MDENIEVKGFDKGEADFLLNCIKLLENETYKMYQGFGELFPNRSAGVFLGNILTNFVGNVLLNANNHSMPHFIEGCEGLVKNLEDFKQKIVLHYMKIEGNA